ncbi:unnamed protein product, partial [Brassica oleracea var. botrytis]|uniref:Uncharacterized protein n=2 Tax=Brassica oleracea TaxID=3712 RepID=A0A0D3BDS7_BRAOL
RFIDLLSPPTALGDYRVSINSFVSFLLNGFITINLWPSLSSHLPLLANLPFEAVSLLFNTILPSWIPTTYSLICLTQLLC